MIKTALIAALLLTLTKTVWAGADGDALKRFGLLGQWGQNCKQPPSKNNRYYGFVDSADGFPQLTEQGYYDKKTVVGEVRDVRAVSKSLVAYLSVSKSSTLRITELLEGRRRRTWSSSNENGTVYVKDGILVSTSTQTSWFEKCEP